MPASDDRYFLLIYTYAPDYIDKRALHRRQHVALVEALVDRGHLLLGGALDNPPDRAYLCFRCADRSLVEDFVRRDPYVLNGLVVAHEIRDWNVVVGTACSNPISSAKL